MKKFLMLFLLCTFAFGQNLFEPGYSGVGFSFSQTTRNIPVKSIAFTRNTSGNYRFEASLNYADEKDHYDHVNSIGFGFSKILFNNEAKVPVSGYSHLGIELLRIRDIYYNLNFGFGLFHNFVFGKYSLVPEFAVDYSLRLGSTTDYSPWGPAQYLNFNNTFIIAFTLNNLFKISDRLALLITPGLVAVGSDYAYKLKAGFNLSF